jgi:ADP-heptose:LPS heptosyltransferase/GT2 family glycosyltransferase
MGASVKPPESKRLTTRSKAVAAAPVRRQKRVAQRGGVSPGREVPDPIGASHPLTPARDSEVRRLGKRSGIAASAAPPLAPVLEPDGSATAPVGMAPDDIGLDDTGSHGGADVQMDPDSDTPPAAEPSDRILIEIDPNVLGGFISHRYDLQIRGWVVATAPVDEVSLLHNDAVVSQLRYGQPSATARLILEDGTSVTPHVFTLSLPRLRSEAGGPCTVSVAARTVNNQTYRETYSLIIDPLLPTQVQIESGPTRSSAEYGGEIPPVVLFVERATLDPSGDLQLIGWAVSLSNLVAIQIFAGEERVGSPRLGVRRGDLARTFPSYPNAPYAGFTLATTLSETARQVTTLRAQAICADGFAHELVVPLELVARRAPPSPPSPSPASQEPPRPGSPRLKQPPPMVPASRATPSLPRQDPVYQLVTEFNLAPDVFAAPPGFVAASAPPAYKSIGLAPTEPVPTELGPTQPVVRRSQDPRRVINHFCDAAAVSPDGEVAVDGWAVCAIGVASIEVWLNDQRLGEAQLGLLREDVGEAYPSITMARYAGFHFLTHVTPPADGEHRLRVVLRNGLDDVAEDVSAHVIDRPKPPPAAEASSEFRFEIDRPSLVNGAMVEPTTGRLTIEGWILSRSGVTEMQVWLDDQRLGDAQHGLARQDVGNAFPDWPNSLRSGYAFHCPPRSLRNGEHVVRIIARAVSGAEMDQSFRIDVRKPEGSDDSGTIRRRMPLVEVDVLTEALAGLDYHPAFRLVLRQNGPIDPALLGSTLASLHGQAYRDWRLTVMAEDSESAAVVRGCLAERQADLIDRVTVIDAGAADLELDLPFGSGPFGAGPSASGDTAAGPRMFGLLCPGDELGCDALIEIALAAAQAPGTDFLYADEIRIGPTSRDREPFCKPDYSPDLLLSTNYIGHPWFATPELLARAEVTPRTLLHDAEYDLVLRCTEHAASIRHLSRLLCRRGSEALDSSSASRSALRRAAIRRGTRADVQETAIPGTFRFRRLKRASGKVSIIIPTCAAHGHIETCIRTLREQTAYRNFEIVCVDNIPPSQVGWKRWLRDNADKVVNMPEAFNWSRFNNQAAAATEGEYLLFLNDDMEVIEPGWLDALLEHAQRPEVGIVGARLLYPGGKVQHAGMFLATPGIARHAFRFAAADEPGYFGLALTQRNVIAVTGACLLVRRDTFDALGRFDEAHEIVNNDLDFCLRAHKAGLFTVYTPYARLIHHELASRDGLDDVFDTGHFARQWKKLFAAGDPFFSPLLSLHADDYRPDDEPVEGVFAGHPLFRRDDIKRILVVKLDHIGDFITALPAIRRLKQHFPTATIHVLAARGARSFAEAETCIDGFIEFEFFHARSGLGTKDLTDEDYAELRARLVPYGLDLAVDLRKHADTREVLRHVPARFLAGYDYMGQFTFLDIALEWEGDKNLHRKRGHVTDDLINLVEAVGTAAAEERNRLSSPTWPAAALPDFLDDAARALFAKPVVAIHPGVGTVMRQWPAEHFAALTDLLVEADGVNALLIGGPDEAELAEEVLGKIVRRDAVISVTGKTSLAELTQLLACCALYVGNNSGPKHIAAAIGVPTIGVHSGVIDPTEWAPIGKRAMALRRNMVCSPCYLARLEDCPRNLACLRQLEPTSVWQACRAMLATGRLPVYVTPVVGGMAVAVGAEGAPERGSPTAAGKPRGGRKRGGKTSPPSPGAPAPVEASAPGGAPIEPLAEDTVIVSGEPVVETPRSRRKRGGKTAPAGPKPTASIEATTHADTPSEPPAEDATVAGESVEASVPPDTPVEPEAPVEPDATVPPAAVDALDAVAERVPQALEGSGDGGPAVTAADESVETQAFESVTDGQPVQPDGPATKTKTRRDRMARASRRPEDVSA